ncbi:MAG TPA: hypothetical protein VJ813_15470 [Vicinamibacterales bacterium]|nr:hypothetical protein [Vicinamibacterales bacterium]
MPVLAAVLVLLVIATPASAQLRGSFTVGAAITTIRPSAAELTTKVKIRPTVGRVPARGWGLALAFNWFDADVAGDFVNAAGRLGQVRIRPAMAGAGYTHVHGRLGVTPSVVAGPALNTLVLDPRWQDQFEVVGSRFERRAGTLSLALRPGVSATYAFTPRFGATAFSGYVFNRPAFRISTPNGDVRTRWTTDGFVLSTGVVVSLF